MRALMPRTKRTPALLPRMEFPFGSINDEFEALFDRLLPAWPEMEMSEPAYPWGVMTEEKEKEVLVRVELPGFELPEIKVEVLEERLIVEAEHREPAEKKEGEPKAERAYAHIKRIITLPPGVEVEKAEAAYKNGVLEVHVPRKPEPAGRRLEIKG